MTRFLFYAALCINLSAVVHARATEAVSAFEGQRLFVSHCMICHGPDGKGNGPLAKNLDLNPVDMTRTLRSRSDTILKKIISGEGGQTISGRDRHNVLTDAMPNWGEVLSDSQIDALIAYLRFLSTAEHEMAGDPVLGREIYLKYCTVCHGEEGYGDGVMTRILDLEPLDHTDPVIINSMSNEEIAQAIKDGDGNYMPAWNGILDDDEIEALVSYIRLLTQ